MIHLIWGDHLRGIDSKQYLNAFLGIGYVPQDHFLFSMTIRDNIRFAQPRASQAEVKQLLDWQ